MKHVKLSSHEIVTLEVILERLVNNEPISLESLPAIKYLADKVRAAEGITLHIPLA